MGKHEKLANETNGQSSASHRHAFARRHLIVGWWTLLLFAAMGMVLEGLHGLKIGYYLDLSNQTRRLMWTLSHTHGTLISLIHLGFAYSVGRSSSWKLNRLRLASRCLLAATLLMPTGFFIGGVRPYAGDPGLAIALVPAGGFLLLVAIGLTASSLHDQNEQ